MSRSTAEWETGVGDQIRSLRLRTGYDQAQLAELASVSVGALKNLEQGKGSTLGTVIKVVRALEREDWLDSLSPASLISPIDVLRAGRSTRSRVYRPRSSAN
jgi:transcriptional regulator with XRE-family HTH domain